MNEIQIRNCAAGLVEKIDRNPQPKLSSDEQAILIVALKELGRKLATSCTDDDEPTTENPV